MSLSTTAFFFFIMIALAAMPSASVALVVVKSATHGVVNGIAVSIGIVAGDLLLMSLAFAGVTVIAEALGALFAIIRIAAASYLIWFGSSLIFSAGSTPLFEAKGNDSSTSSLLKSAIAGFTLTLSDIKAILFYASLFPTLFDLASLSGADIVVIFALTSFALGGVKVAYAIAARGILQRLGRAGLGRKQWGRRVAGGTLIGAGALVIAKT